MKTGTLFLVSVGPGISDLIPPLAEKTLKASEAIVSYDLYLNWIRPWIEGKEIHTMPLTKETERAALAIDLARKGKKVSLLSSGDIGIYAMAAVAFDLLEESDTFEIKVIPGISAANSCASILGSPLSHDFSTLSLSDLLCPWEWIEHRARHIAQADLVSVLYNVQSKQRREGVYKILDIFLGHKKPETCCGIVRNAYREDQKSEIVTLAELSKREFDMFTSIIIGNRFTREKRGFLYTPRGYRSWNENTPTEVEVKKTGDKKSVWIFSGTSDGNRLAQEISQSGFPTIISTASDYGKEIAIQNCPGLTVRSGRMGVEMRRQELKRTEAISIIDATHPFASEISKQLISLSEELGIPYWRYERPASPLPSDAILCRDISEAAQKAIQMGKRIFLATGSKDLDLFLKSSGAENCHWFARVTPDTSSIDRAFSLGIPRNHLCAMQGPFSSEFNQVLWSNWKIDCVVTKESGDAGGFHEKAQAAQKLKIPFIVIQRPKVDYPQSTSDFGSVLHDLQLLNSKKTNLKTSII
ncbi:MAG: precorrin-3B C(17)-methyltransferase [Verrucomicrobiota bacterium]